MILDAPPSPSDSIAYLEAELRRYELAYQMSTEEFLVRCASEHDDLADVEDASFWQETATILDRIRREGEAVCEETAETDGTNGGSKGPSVTLWTSNRITVT